MHDRNGSAIRQIDGEGFERPRFMNGIELYDRHTRILHAPKVDENYPQEHPSNPRRTPFVPFGICPNPRVALRLNTSRPPQATAPSGM
jgi:hypothetical protein